MQFCEQGYHVLHCSPFTTGSGLYGLWESRIRITNTLSLVNLSHLFQCEFFSFCFFTQPVGQALVHALSIAIADKFTAEVKDSWIQLYAIVQLKMEEGMKEGMELNC